MFRRPRPRWLRFVPQLAGLTLATMLSAAPPAHAADATFVVPPVAGLKIRVGETVALPGCESAIVHRFEDGRLVVAGKDRGIWSEDGGRTWTAGPRGPDDKTSLNLGDG